MTTELTPNNYFNSLSIPLLGKVLGKTGELSKMALVSRRFNEAAKHEALKIFRGLSLIYGRYPVQCLLDKFSLADKPLSAQVDGLFYAGIREASLKRGQLKAPPSAVYFHPTLLSECADPYVKADDMIKFWMALYKSASLELRVEMDKIAIDGDPLVLAEKMERFLVQHKEQLASVETLNLSGQDIRSLPKEIGLFVHLKTLNLSHNRLTDLPPEISHLQELKKLDLNKNRLTALPLPVCDLQSLEQLTLFSNRLTTLPEAIVRLSKLQILFLGENSISLLPEQIGKLESLICLCLDNNRLESLPSTIGSLAHLRALFLYGNQLADLPQTIGSLTDLLVLSLANNQLKRVPDEIGCLSSLETFFLSNNALKELPRSLGGLRSLQLLFVDGNQLRAFPVEMQFLKRLASFWFEGNPIENIPQELEAMPYWSLDPNLHPRPEKKEGVRVLNEAISVEQMWTVYFQLEDNKWKECIDGEFHALGRDVFDKGLHGKVVEPGFDTSMAEAFKFLGKNLNRRIDSHFYLELHAVACQHFIGEKGGTAVDRKKIGVFRDWEDVVDADFKEDEYPFMPAAIKEFNELSQRISATFGPLFSLGKIVPLKAKEKGRRIIYHRMSAAQVKMIFDFFLAEFYCEIGHAKTCKQKLEAIARVIQRLEWLHPPCDGCGRTDTALLNYLLTCYGFHPVLLNLPYRSSCRGFKEWVEVLEEGLLAWENETA